MTQPTQVAHRAIHEARSMEAVAQRVYEHVAERLGGDIVLDEVEAACGFRWREHTHVAEGRKGRATDPMYSQQLAWLIGESFQQFLILLVQRVAILPGLQATESTEARGATLRVDHAIDVMCRAVVPYLKGDKGSGATHEDMLAAAVEAARGLTVLYTTQARDVAVSQLTALRLLEKLCTMAMARNCIGELLVNQHVDDLRILVSHPPHQFVAECARCAVPFVELSDFLYGCKCVGARGAASLSPSGATRELSIQKWAERYGARVLQCIAAVRPDIVQLTTASDDAAVWHGLRVLDASDAVVKAAVEDHGFGVVVHAPEAEHSHAGKAVVLLATHPAARDALLVPRLVHATIEFLRQRRFTMRTLRAELALPVVRRWQSEAGIQRERLIAELGDDYHREEEEEQEEEEDSGEDEYDEDEYDDDGFDVASQQSSTTTHSVPSTPVPMPNSSLYIVPGRVPQSLERDHAVLQCVRDMILDRTYNRDTQLVFVSIKDIATRTVLRTSKMFKATTASMIQCISFILSKRLKRDDIFWKTDRPWSEARAATMERPSCNGVVIQPNTNKDTVADIDKVIHAMENSGTIFAKRWFPTRYARSHSNRALAKRSRVE